MVDGRRRRRCDRGAGSRQRRRLLLGPYRLDRISGLLASSPAATGSTVFKAKRRNKLLVQFPDALMMIVRAVRVGVPVSQAIHIIAHEQPQPTSDEFALLANQFQSANRWTRPCCRWRSMPTFPSIVSLPPH